MVVVEGTVRDLVRAHIDLCFMHKPLNTKKTVEDILHERDSMRPEAAALVPEIADEMVGTIYVNTQDREYWVFDKDEDEYFLRDATRGERFKYRIRSLVH